MSHATPRLSVVLPVDSVAANRPGSAFEQTLISVLENRRGGTEVIVAHDGSYADPFDLGDEVRFAIAESAGLIDTIAVGCDAAWGRYVGVISAGTTVTDGWCGASLSALSEPGIAAVAPRLMDVDGEVIASGWRDTAVRLMDPVVPQPGVRSISAAKVHGVYLESSVWRREVLRSLVRACGPTSVTLATYAYAQLCRTQDWSCVASDQCVMVTDQPTPTIDGGGLGRARLLRRLHRHFRGSSAAGALIAAMRSVVSEPAEAIGTASAGLIHSNLDRWFEPSQVYAAEQYAAARRVA